MRSRRPGRGKVTDMGHEFEALVDCGEAVQAAVSCADPREAPTWHDVFLNASSVRPAWQLLGNESSLT